MIHQAKQFLNYDLWRIQAKKLSKGKSFAIRALRVFILSFKEFNRDRCAYAASALTFYSILSIVPVFAMAFGIAKGFGLEKSLQNLVIEKFYGQEEVMTRLIEFSQSLLQNTQGGVIAGIGVAFLFWTIIRLFSNIEKSFNEIWGVKEERTLSRKFTDYLSILLISPILLVVSTSLTVFITTQVRGMTQSIAFFGYFHDIIFFALSLLPVMIIWGLLTFLYIFMPNTRVNFMPGLVGGIVSGTIYQIVQTVYITFQLQVSNYGAIYGSFAALPLFLIWLQLSWLIVLYGAEIAFAHQNEETYEFEPDCLNVSPSFKSLLALQLTHVLVKRFQEGKPPVHLRQLSNDLEIPIRLVRQLIHNLEVAGILIEAEPIGRKDKDEYYVPACPLENLTMAFILSALEKCGKDTVPVLQNEASKKIVESMAKMKEAQAQSSANLRLADL